MAFGTATGRTDLEFVAKTGSAKADIGELRRVYHASTGAMSDDALRLAVAQEKLDRALVRSGPNSTAVKTATLGLRRELEQLESQQRQTAGATDRASSALSREQREVSRFGRGALVGTGALHGLGRAAAFASTSFLGGAGLIYGIKSALAAASDLHEQTSKTEVVFDRAAGSVIRFAKDALGLARDQALEATSSIGALLRPLGILPREAAKIAVELTKRGVDLSSFYNTTVADALAAVQSGLVGQVRPLRRYGAALDAARVTELALAQTGKEHAKELTNREKLLARVALILKDTSLAQGDYQRTLGGVANQEREVQKNIRNTEETIGTKLEPRYLHLLQTVNRYLGSGKNQEEITRHVERALHDAGLVAKGFAHGLDLIHKATAPVIDALGGLDNAAELALIIGIVRRARRAAISFGLISAASGATKTKVVADAAEIEAALDAATRPRVAEITVVERGGTTTGPVGGRGGGGGRKTVPIGLGTVATVAAVVVSTGGGGRSREVNTGTFEQQYPLVTDLWHRAATRQPLSPEEEAVLKSFGQYSLANAPDSILNAAERRLRQARRGTRASFSSSAHTRTTATPGPAGGGNAPTPRGAVTAGERVSRARLAVARGTPGAQAELTAALRAQIAYDRKYERIQEDLIRRGVGDRKQHQQILDRLRSDEESALNEISSTEDARARARQTAANKARTAVSKAAAARRAERAGEIRGVSALPKRFTIRENQADTLPELGAVYRSELAFQQTVVANLRRRHAGHDVIEAALLEESTIQAKIHRNRVAIAKKQRAARDASYQKLLDELAQPSLALRIRQAKIDVAKAHGKDTTGDELKLLQDELAEASREYQAALKVASTKKKKDEVTLAYWEGRAQIEQQIADAKGQAKQREGSLAREFLSEYMQLVATYAPNITGGTGPGASSVTVNQHFPHPPSSDGHREATWAKVAFGAVFD